MKEIFAAAVLVCLLFLTSLAECAVPSGAVPGLEVTFSPASGKATASTVRPNVFLFVPAGQSPSAWIPEGGFSAEWNGFVSSELRADYQFLVELRGRASLEINGRLVQEFDSPATAQASSTAGVRLNKGTNAFRVRYTRPDAGDAVLRLSWFNRETPPGPVPSCAFTHLPTAALQKSSLIRTGRDLFIEQRCAACHRLNSTNLAGTELSMDAPTFEGIGSRRKASWMKEWILDPRSGRPSAEMPKLLRGPSAAQDAEAVAAFLFSLKGNVPASKEATRDQVELGQKLFDSLHCAACHVSPEESKADPGLVDLKGVSRKFTSASLHAFLKKPEAHFAWIRMPNFRLTDEEAVQLAGYLVSKSLKPGPEPELNDPSLITRGRDIVQSKGCLQCHAAKLENRYKAVHLDGIPADHWTQGCLSTNPPDGAPDYRFKQSEVASIQALAGSGLTALLRNVPAEAAERHVSGLRCAECHGKFDGFPALEILGSKLRPEFMSSFIAGNFDAKPRPWLDARMPGFPARAARLAEGLAHLNGWPAHTPQEPPPDPASVETGRKLVSAAGGFSCISCHGIAAVPPTQVFESPGINLALTASRLQKPYFLRWLRNPLSVEPTTKMPVYFDEEGRSPLQEILGGDGEKQREAIWQYIRLGPRMPAPPVP